MINVLKGGLPDEFVEAATRSWQGWHSPAENLMLAWPHASHRRRLDNLVESGKITSCDAFRFRVLKTNSVTGWARRQAWYEALAGVLVRTPGNHDEVHVAKVMAMDALNVIDPADSVLLLVEAAKTLVAATGRDSAVAVLDGVYGTIIPELGSVERVCGQVPAFTFGGRIYVL